MVNTINRSEYDAVRLVLVKQRQVEGLTQVELASRLGRTQSFVSKYELGERRLDVVEFIAICRALEVSPTAVMKLIWKQIG